MKVGDLVEWIGGWHYSIDKAGRIGVVTDMMPNSRRPSLAAGFFSGSCWRDGCPPVRFEVLS